MIGKHLILGGVAAVGLLAASAGTASAQYPHHPGEYSRDRYLPPPPHERYLPPPPHEHYRPPVVYVEPRPVYVEPRRVYVEPRPYCEEPRPVYLAPKPVYVEPRPVYVAPQPRGTSFEFGVNRPGLSFNFGTVIR